MVDDKMDIKKLISTKTYDLVLYNHQIKKVAFQLLRFPLIINNPIYNFFYEREMKNKMEKYEKIPFRVTIENTNVCNANCTFCPHKKMKRKQGFMKFSLFKKIVNEYKSLGIGYVTVYGFGEPLLDPNFVKEIEYAKSEGIGRVTTNTNAALLTPKVGKKLIEAGLDEIYISVDAATEATYKKIRPNLDFKKVEENIMNLIKLRGEINGDKPIVILSYVELEANKNETQDFISKWKGIVDNISISQIHNWTGDIIYNGQKFNYRRKDPCRLLWTDMAINWDGDVPLCCNDYEARVCLGNIKDSSIQEVWSGKKLQKIREFHEKKQFNEVPICKNCEYNYHDKSAWWISK